MRPGPCRINSSERHTSAPAGTDPGSGHYNRFSLALATVATCCLAVLTAVVAYRTVSDRIDRARPRRVGATAAEAPVPVRDWAALTQGGQHIGPPSAPITIVEFTDFQCPFCTRFAV